MKVTPKEIGEIAGAEKTRMKKDASVPFRQVLQEIQSQSSPAAPSKGISLPPLTELPKIKEIPPDNAGEKPLAAEAERLLNLLETYQKQMESPQFSLKDIQPLIEKMGRETERLRPVMEALPEGSTIRDILNRMLVASSVEVIKFNRGDYL